MEEALIKVAKQLELCNRSLLNSAKYMLLLIAMLIVLLSATNMVWLSVFNSYEYVTEEITYEQDGNGINTFNSGTIGDIINGTDNKSDQKDCNEKK